MNIHESWSFAWIFLNRHIQFAAMSLCELQVKTLQGGVFTLDVREIETVQQLKRMLLEKFPGNPVDQRSCTAVAY